MPGYATGSIAGIDLQKDGEDLRAVILDGARLLSARAVNNRLSANGNLYTQSITLTAGIAFGVRLDYCSVDVLQAILIAIKAAIDSQTGFSVTLEDDLHNINVNAVPDGSDWLQYPEGRITNQVKGVILRFLTA
jgi:hypothetical protein